MARPESEDADGRFSSERWEAHRARAAAVGRGRIVTPEEERLAATDELLASCLPTLMRVASLVTLTAIEPGAALCGAPLAREAAGVLRALDGALDAHGRDHRYDVGAWRCSAVTVAAFTEEDLAAGEVSAVDVIYDVGRFIAAALVALRRDRLGVPECLAEAAGRTLALYAAAYESLV